MCSGQICATLRGCASSGLAIALCVQPHERADAVKSVQVEQALLEAGMQPDVPTLVLSECVLVYLKSEESNAVVQLLGSFFSSAAIAVRSCQLHAAEISEIGNSTL